MGNASGHQCKVKISGSEKKVNENTYDISSIKRVTKKFLEVSRCSRAKQRQRNVQKSVLHARGCTCKVALLLIRPIVVFSPFSFPSPLKGDVTLDDSQRRFLAAQHSAAMLEQCCDHSKQCCNAVLR